MKTIKITLLAGALVAATGIAAAQPAPARGPVAEVSRDQALARADAQFQRMDANRDGRVTAEELRQLGESRRAQRSERRAERRGQMFDRLDRDRNGQISREEFSQRAEMRGERGQGRRGMRGMRGMRGPGGGQQAMRGGGRMLGSDGVMTVQEFRQRAVERFDRVDANRDGRITVEERRAVRGQHRGGRRGGPADQPQD